MKKLGLLLLLTVSSISFANTKQDVQKAMKTYVGELTKGGAFMPVMHKGKILKLKVLKSKKYPDGFHSGVKSHGNLFVSCADFTDVKGNNYDIDFLVSKLDRGYRVVQPIVHSINKEKNPYDLGH